MTASEELLSLWERGQRLAPLDRAAMLSWVGGALLSERDEEPAPIGTAYARIFALRKTLFGAEMVGLATCPACGATLETHADVDQFLACPRAATGVQEMDLDGRRIRFRLPTLEDLLNLDPRSTPESAARALLRACLVEPDDLAAGVEDGVLEQMADRDPLADATLSLRCDACGVSFAHAIDIAAFLWREIEGRTARLLGDVHVMARAYGWSEREILAMNPGRRQVYLDLIGA